MKNIRIMAIVLAAVLLMPLLAGCGSTSADPSPTEKPYRVGIYWESAYLTKEETVEQALKHTQINFEIMDELGITHDEGSTVGNYPYWDLTEDDPIEEYNKQYELCIQMYEKLIPKYEEQIAYCEKRLGEIDKENEPAGEWYYNEKIEGYGRLIQRAEDSISEIEALMESGEKKVLLGEHDGPLDGLTGGCPSSIWITLQDLYIEYPDTVIYEWTGDDCNVSGRP